MAATAQFVHFGPFFSAGALVTAPKLYHYVVGTTTDKDVWTNNTKTVTAAQPVVGDANGVVSCFADGFYRFIIKDSADNTLYTWDYYEIIPDEVSASNPIINGHMNIWQRGTSFTSTTTPANNDDTYLMDRWYLLSDGNDIVDVTRESSVVPTGSQYAVCLDVETVNKKFGIAQIIRAADSAHFIGSTVTLSFQAKVSATTNLDNVKAAIVAWNGTANVVTSDIVSAWNVEGTNPTLVGNATYENTPANLSVTTSYATYSVTGALDTASAANIVLFIWSDVTTTSLGEFLYITDVKLELGSAATPMQFVPLEEELMRCQAYYQKSFAIGTAPAQNAGTTNAANMIAVTAGAAAQRGFVRLPMRMFSAPTVTCYNPSAANAEVRDTTLGADCADTILAAAGEQMLQISCTGNAGSSATNRLSFHYTADAEL